MNDFTANPPSTFPFDWSRPPNRAQLDAMRAAELQDVLNRLDQPLTPCPPEVVAWVRANSPVQSDADVARAIEGWGHELRSGYVRGVVDRLLAAEKREKTAPPVADRFKDLSQRTARLWMAVDLGLRSERERALLQNDTQALWQAQITPRDWEGFPFSRHPEALDNWERKLRAIEVRLAPLDPAQIKQALDRRLAQPFTPQPEEIASTQAQMGSWDAPATFGDAERLLKQEFEQRYQALQAWRQDLDAPPAPRPRR